MPEQQSEEKPYFPYWKTPESNAEIDEFLKILNKIGKEQPNISFRAAMKKFVSQNPEFFNDGNEILRIISL
jgi:hypothetical protein